MSWLLICELTVILCQYFPCIPMAIGHGHNGKEWKLERDGSAVVGGGDESAGSLGRVANLGAS